MAYIITINYNTALNVFIFLHVWLLLVLNNFLKWLIDNFSNDSLKFIANRLNYSFIETISYDNYISSSEDSDSEISDNGYISEFDCIVDKIIKKEFLSFIFDIDFSKHNKYRYQSDEGVYIIRSAFTFRKNNKSQTIESSNGDCSSICNIVSIDNKLTIWCRIISPDKLYLDDIKRIAKEKDNKFYFFMILEELKSGFKHKILIDVAKKITLPDRRSLMFSKISIQQCQQMTSFCD
jgi:hypothetical protein